MRASKDTTMVHVGSLIVDEMSYVIILNSPRADFPLSYRFLRSLHLRTFEIMNFTFGPDFNLILVLRSHKPSACHSLVQPVSSNHVCDVSCFPS